MARQRPVDRFGEYEDWNMDALLEEAAQLGIAVEPDMSKNQLAKRIRQAQQAGMTT